MRNLKPLILVTGLLLSLPLLAFELPMLGWSTWHVFQTNLDEKVMQQQADLMVSRGLKKAGYVYINIDDGYWDGRDVQGKLVIDKKKFPGGFKAWTDYVHKLGLKAGIYTVNGYNSCAGYKNIGFHNHIASDVQQYFNDWKFDFLKLDDCGAGSFLNREKCYRDAYDTIKLVSKRPVNFEVASGNFPGVWAAEFADSWRASNDLIHSWGSVWETIKANLYMSAYTQPGHYNDLDMLVAGDPCLNEYETITHMVFWSINSSPLVHGVDLTKMPQWAVELICNPEIIAIDQDKLGVAAPVVQREKEVFVLAKDLKKFYGKQRAVVVTNLEKDTTINVSLEALGFKGPVAIRDIVTRKNLAQNVTTSFSVRIPTHGSRAFVVTGSNRLEKTRYEAEEAWLRDMVKVDRENLVPTYAFKEHTSGNEIVSKLGNSAINYLVWKNVYSKKGGKYRITISYLSGEDRGMSLSVNGKVIKTFSNLNQGNWDNVGTVTAEITLNKGFNEVKLNNDSAPMPDIDCMELSALY